MIIPTYIFRWKCLRFGTLTKEGNASLFVGDEYYIIGVLLVVVVVVVVVVGNIVIVIIIIISFLRVVGEMM